jgi:hypothetical protein
MSAGGMPRRHPDGVDIARGSGEAILWCMADLDEQLTTS